MRNANWNYGIAMASPLEQKQLNNRAARGCMKESWFNSVLCTKLKAYLRIPGGLHIVGDSLVPCYVKLAWNSKGASHSRGQLCPVLCEAPPEFQGASHSAGHTCPPLCEV